MELLYNQEEIWKLDWLEARRQGWQEGRREGRQEGRQEGLEEGEQNGLLRAIKSLTETTGISIEQAMTSLKIADAEKPKYLALLKK